MLGRIIAAKGHLGKKPYKPATSFEALAREYMLR